MTEALIPGEEYPVGLWFALAAVGVLGAVGAAYLALSAGGDGSAGTLVDSVAVMTDDGATGSASDPDQTSEGEPAPAGPVTDPDPGPSAGQATEEPVTEEPVVEEPVVEEPAPEPSVAQDCPPPFEVLFPHSGVVPADEVTDEELAAVVEWAARYPEVVLVVEGHADATGAETQNLAVSFHRAEVVADLLVEAGVPADQLQPRGFGEYQVMAGEDPDSGRNRRVTLSAPGFAQCEPGHDAGPEGATAPGGDR